MSPSSLSESKATQCEASKAEEPTDNSAILLAFGVLALGFFSWRKVSGRGLPKRVELADVLLLGGATHKLSRLLAKGKITEPIRAPFVQDSKPDGAAEVDENPKGAGMRHAIGSLLTCPYCVGVWIASALMTGLICVPRPTRIASALFSSVTLSDFLHQAYCTLKDRDKANSA